MPTSVVAAKELAQFYTAYGPDLARWLYLLVEELADRRGYITLAEVIAAEAKLACR
jgi:hypothetical protein